MARKGKRYRSEVLEYTANLEENLLELQHELSTHTYEVGAYREFFVYEPKQRMIMALPFRDRVVQWAIYLIVNPIFEKKYYDHSYACRVGKGTHKAVDQLQYWLRIVNKRPEKYYYLKMDIAKYFYRVDHNILMNLVAKTIKDKELLDLLSTIVSSESTKFGLPEGSSLVEVDERVGDKGMPIGNLTSQLFANVYLNELDKFIKHKLGTKHYIRYMDDFILLSEDKAELHRWKDATNNFLKESLALQTNRKTCIRPISLGIEFVGYQVWSTHRKLRKSTTKRMRRNLKYTQKQFARGLIDAENVRQTVMSYIALLDTADSHRLKETLSETYVFKRGDQKSQKQIS